MTPATILRLNQLNQAFYDQVGADFDDSRQHFWPGWDRVGEYLKLEKIPPQASVLDLGCGNGRFGAFLASYFSSHISYTGLDNNQLLLTRARESLDLLNQPPQLIKADLVEGLLNRHLYSILTEKYDLIVTFGLLHHLPSIVLRQNFLKSCRSWLKPNGKVVITTWQFMEFERLKKKVIKPTVVNINPQELEKNDFILDWQRGQSGYRYCHYLDETEQKGLIETCGLKIKAEFRADGKEGSVNQYYILG